MKEEDYEKALEAYEELGRQANVALERLIEILRSSESKLKELENTIFDHNIKEKLEASAAEIEAGVNAAKDRFFEEFESAHADDIKAIENALTEKKEQLKASIETNG